MKTIDGIKQQVNVVQLAYKKIAGNKSIELLMHIKLSDMEPFYWVMYGGGAAMYKGFFLDDALIAFNKFN